MIVHDLQYYIQFLAFLVVRLLLAERDLSSLYGVCM